MKWVLKNTVIPQNHAQIKELLLEGRKIDHPQEFFNPTHPLDIELEELEIDSAQIKKALELILETKEKKGKIIIFGDYDADGICATATLWRILYDLSCDVLPFIPDRKKHGYGITPKSLKEIVKKHQPELIITVDNGIVAHEAIEFLNGENIKSIITDHHSPDENLPQASAIVHSTKLCGASVAWILGRELLKKTSPKNYEKIINTQLDLCGIATIADQVPLGKENRSFAKWGIEALKKTTRVGLKKLFERTKIEPKKIDSNTINFAIAPRINAMGRLKHGLPTLQLLCTPNAQQASKLVEELTLTNSLRQDITQKQVELAESQLQDQLDLPLLITHSDQYHEGVIGLIAGRLCEKYHKPVIALSLDGKMAKGSARSIAGVNIVELIREVKEDLLAVGGHPMAAGFGLEIDKLDLVTEKLQKLATAIDQSLFEKFLNIEMIIPLSLVDEELLSVIDKFKPFGQKNSEPIFGINNLSVVQASQIGRDGTHLRLSAKDDKGNYLSTIGWRMGNLAPTFKTGDKINLGGTFSINEWQNKRTVQMTVKSITNHQSTKSHSSN